MSTPTSRAYSGAEDLRAMLDLLVAVRPADRITDYPSLGDLQEILALKRVQDNTRLWFDAKGRMLGFACVDHYNNLYFEVDPKAPQPQTESEVVAWGVECLRRRMHETGQSMTLDASCRDDRAERIEMLQRHGFVLQATRWLHMARSLHEPIPPPQVPAGFYMRHVSGTQEAPALVALHRAAFGTENMTVEERLAMMGVPGYDPSLDLLVAAADGRLAANCLCSIHLEQNERSGRSEGHTDPVVTHPDFQRRGLARALLLTGLQKLKQRGIRTAVLGTSSENLAMRLAAEAAGFRVQSTTLWFVKPVSQ